MTEEKILTYACGALLSIVIFFLKGIFSRLKTVEMKAIDIDKEVGIIKADQNNSNKRFDELNASFKALSDKIDNKIDMIMAKLNDHHN